MTSIQQAEQGEDLELAGRLFREYADALDCAPCFKDLDLEINGLPGEYAPPSGRLLLALYDGRSAGCVALKRLDAVSCEMKRLYVRPEFRGKGIGRALARAIIEEAGKIGYTYLRLNTLPSMKEAINLYNSLGFRGISPYGANQMEGALYMELALERT